MVPIASGYAPINDLNASIMAQDARGMADRLARQEMNNRMIAEAINAQVRQKQIASESGDRQQHYGLQRQQLANDMAYRNRALGMTEAQQAEANKQFYAKLQQDKELNPYGTQADNDAEIFNSEALSGESEANGKKEAIDNAYNIARGRITKGRYFTDKGRQEDLDDLDTKHAYEVAALQQSVKHGDKIRLNKATGRFEAIQRATKRGAGGASSQPQPTLRGNEQPQFGESGFDYSGGGDLPVGAVNTTPVARSAPITQGVPFSPDFMGAAKMAGQAMFQPWKSFGLFGSGPQAPASPQAEASGPFGGISWNSAPPGFIQGGATKPAWTGSTNAPAPSGGIGWSRTQPMQPMQPMQTVQSPPVQPSAGPGLLPIGLPVQQAQAVEGFHYRSNPDGSVTVLSPIIKSNGQIIPPGTTGMIR